MAGLSEIAINTAPILGGVLLATAAGQVKGPDYRSAINQDLDLLERLPADQVTRRAAILRTVELRIDDMVSATEKSRQFRAAAASYQGNWRDIVLLVCAVLFTVVWWHVSHHRTNWPNVYRHDRCLRPVGRIRLPWVGEKRASAHPLDRNRRRIAVRCGGHGGARQH